MKPLERYNSLDEKIKQRSELTDEDWNIMPENKKDTYRRQLYSYLEATNDTDLLNEIIEKEVHDLEQKEEMRKVMLEHEYLKKSIQMMKDMKDDIGDDTSPEVKELDKDLAKISRYSNDLKSSISKDTEMMNEGYELKEQYGEIVMVPKKKG